MMTGQIGAGGRLATLLALVQLCGVCRSDGAANLLAGQLGDSLGGGRRIKRDGVATLPPYLSGGGSPGAAVAGTHSSLLTSKWAAKTLPLTQARDPVRVDVMLYLESLRDVSSDVTLDFYMIERWKDLRYIGMVAEEESWRSPYDTIKIPGLNSEKFWFPDSYFYLVKAVTFDRNAQFMEVAQDGTVCFNRKVRIVIPCKPNVRMFPFDVTTCKLMMSSYAYTTRELTYTWNLQGIWQDEDAHDYIEEAGFTLVDIPVENVTLNYSTGQSFSAITGDFKLKRKYLVYIVQTFVPSALITALSWITFWISRNATPARASIGITTVLTMLTLGSGSSSRYDKHINGSISAIDIYVWVCFSFVILSLLEFAFADYWNQVETAATRSHKPAHPPSNGHLASQKQSEHPHLVIQKTPHSAASLHHRGSTGVFNSPPLSAGDAFLNNNCSPLLSSDRSAESNLTSILHDQSVLRRKPRTQNAANIDLVARWVFPLAFFIFNIIYWYVIFWHLA